jgi:major membrane immunogen (membrane-anchored lipoprotein)
MNARRNKMKKIALTLLSLSLALLLLVGCGDTALRDGTYVGRSGEDDDGAWAEVTLTITDGEVLSCEFITWQADGTIKDEEYGKVNGEISNQAFYNKAQLAVEAMEVYERQFAENGSLDDVDAVAGATISYDQFCEAVEDALRQASA